MVEQTPSLQLDRDTFAITGANTPSAFAIGSPVMPLLTIHNDGMVEADIADMPEAAKVLAEHVQMHMQQWAENIRAAERARILAAMRQPDAAMVERVLMAGYILTEEDTRAALSAAADHMEAGQ